MTARLKALVFPLLLMIAGCEDDTDFPMPVAGHPLPHWNADISPLLAAKGLEP